MIITKNMTIREISVNCFSGYERGERARAVGWDISLKAAQDYRFFIDQRDPEDWVVTELSAGYVVARGKSYDDAIAAAEEILQQVGPKKLAKAVRKAIAMFGESNQAVQP